jgi:arylsulfatase A-like enzyme
MRLALLLSFVLLTCVGSLDAGPNVIIIMTDDQGYQDLGCFGSPKIKTPHIDRMAREGMRFTDFYSGASVCTPSRAALMTGCYASRVGNLPVLFPNSQRGLNPDEITIAEVMKSKGYATACIGKWHLGHLKQFLPVSQGFDTYYGVPYSNDMTIDPTQPLANDIVLREGVTLETIKKQRKRNLVPLMRDAEIIEYPVDQNTLTKRYTDEAIRFIQANKERPFFIYLPHTMPHIPLYATPEFEGKSEIGLYGDCIEEIDASTGRILDTLRALKLDQKTLVVFTSDNGPWKLAKNAWVKGNKNRRVGGFAHPLRGYKFSRFEGGMRVPTVMWWPGRIPANRTCSEVVASMDLMPTCAELAGAKVPDDRVIDGKSIVSLLEGRDGAKSPHEAFFYRTEGVRVGEWKLKGKALFHLKTDIAEAKNVAAEHPEVVSRLGKLLADFKADLKKNGRPAGGPPPKPRKPRKPRQKKPKKTDTKKKA